MTILEKIEKGKKLTKSDIASLRTAYRQYRTGLICQVSDDGNGFLLNGVYRDSMCGCKVIGNGTLHFPLRVQHCKEHAVKKKSLLRIG